MPEKVLSIKMFNLIPITTYDLLISIALSLTLIVLGLILFTVAWLNTTDFYFPLAGYDEDDDPEDVQEGRVKLDNIYKYFKALLHRLIWLDSWYWTRYSGFECTFILP